MNGEMRTCIRPYVDSLMGVKSFVDKANGLNALSIQAVLAIYRSNRHWKSLEIDSAARRCLFNFLLAELS